MGRGGRFAIAATYAVALVGGCSLVVDTKGLSGGGGDGGAPTDAIVSTDAASDDAATDGALADGAAKTYRDVVLADDPLAYWRLGEKSGNVAKDASGHGHDASYRAGCTFGEKGALVNDADTAVRFQGTCAVEAADIDFAGTSPFSLEAWALHEGIDSTYRHLFNKDAYPAGGREQWGVYIQSGNGMTFERYVMGDVHAAGLSAPAKGAWFHMVATYDGSRMRIYVDGVERDSASDTRSQAPKNVPLVMGANGTTSPWNGLIDEIAVYAKTLDPAAVKRHHDASK